PSTGSKKADAAFAVSAFFVLAAKNPRCDVSRLRETRRTSLSEVQFVSVNRLQKSRCRFCGVCFFRVGGEEPPMRRFAFTRNSTNFAWRSSVRVRQPAPKKQMPLLRCLLFFKKS
ncbi:MAG: hypothetical protein IJN07_02380, partial [Clostridia bacterium]|nr:hypothetical protein [Clostridia bacterium]